MVWLDPSNKISTAKQETAKGQVLPKDEAIAKVTKAPLEQQKLAIDISLSPLSQKNVTIENSDTFSPTTSFFLYGSSSDFPLPEAPQAFKNLPELNASEIDFGDYDSFGMIDPFDETQIPDSSNSFISQSTSFSKKRKLDDFDEEISALYPKLPSSGSEEYSYSSSSSSSSSSDSFLDTLFSSSSSEDSASSLPSSSSSGTDLTAPTMEITSSQSESSSISNLSELPFHPFKAIPTNSHLTAPELVQCYKLWKLKRLGPNYIEVSDQVKSRQPMNYPLLMIEILVTAKDRKPENLSKEFKFNEASIRAYRDALKEFPKKAKVNMAIVTAAATLIEELDKDKKKPADLSTLSSVSSVSATKEVPKEKRIIMNLANNPFESISNIDDFTTSDFVKAYNMWKQIEAISGIKNPEKSVSEKRKPSNFPLLMIAALVEKEFLKIERLVIAKKYHFSVCSLDRYTREIKRINEKNKFATHQNIREAAHIIINKLDIKEDGSDISLSPSENSFDKISSKVQETVSLDDSKEKDPESFKKNLANNPYKPISSIRELNSIDLKEAYNEWTMNYSIIVPKYSVENNGYRKPTTFPLLMIDALIEIVYLKKAVKDISEKFHFSKGNLSNYAGIVKRPKEKYTGKNYSIAILEATSSLIEELKKKTEESAQVT